MSINGKRGFFWITVLLLFFVFLFMIRSILLPFVLGIFIAFFLNPPTDKLERYGLSRALATAIVICSFFLVFIMLSVLIVPAVIGQVSTLIEAIPGYVTEFQTEFEPKIEMWLGKIPFVSAHGFKSTLSNTSDVIMQMGGEFIGSVFHSGMAIVNIVSLIVITPVVAFYLLEDWHRIIARIDSWLPRAHADVIRNQVRIINRTLAGFVRGQLNVCLIVATYYAILLSILGLKFSIIIGIMTGFLLIVPYAGWLVGASSGILVAFFQYEETSQVLTVAGVFIIGQIFEAYFLTPRLVGQKVGLHPVWIIFGMLAGGALFGFVGVLLAVPLTAVIGVLSRFALQRYLQSSYYQGEIYAPTLTLPPPL